MLRENDQIISDETTVADTKNKRFLNIIEKLKLRYKDHQSIVKIQSQINDKNNLFLFKSVTSE